MKETLIAFVLMFGLSSILLAQEEQVSEEQEPKHLITFAFGYTFIPKATSVGGTEAQGIFVPSVGFDYFYRISPKWEIGTMFEIELGNYVIFDKDLNRDKAMVIAAIGAYSLTKHINIFGGGGIELEKHKNLAIFRLGTEYQWKFKNNWVLAPGFFYDIKEHFDTWSVSVAIGKEF